MLDTNEIYYVYMWYIVPTQEIFYIGKGKNKRYKNITKRNKFFLDMYHTHDCDVKIIADHLAEKEAYDIERYVIQYLKKYTNNRLTNQSDGGEGGLHYKFPEEIKKKISITNKNKWKNPEYLKKMIDLRNDPIGVYKSQEFRDKISQLVRGKNNPNYHNYWSQEQKEHLSRLKKGKYLRAENSNAKKIINLEKGEIFNFIEDAADKYKVSSANISVALNKEVRTAANLHWQYYSEQLINKKNRKDLLINVLCKSQRVNSYICLETQEIFVKQKDLFKHLQKTQKAIKKLTQADGKIIIDNYTYMPIKQYVNCPVH